MEALIARGKRDEATGCLLWTGTKDGKCGQTTFNGKQLLVRRVIMMMSMGVTELPKGTIVISIPTCTSPSCFEITHLKLGTCERKLDLKTLESFGKRDEKNGCLLWQAGKAENGYGVVRFNKRSQPVHRVAMMIHMGVTELLEDIQVRHGPTCVRNCYEITHLKTGTRSQNNFEDKLESGSDNRGQKHWNVRLTDTQAGEVKCSKFPYGHPEWSSQRTRAKKFTDLFGIDVTFHMVGGIDAGRCFSYLPDRLGKVTDNSKYRKGVTCRKKKARGREISEAMWEEAAVKLRGSIKESVDIQDNVETKCHLFQGYISPAGYGNISIFGAQFQAHLLACSVKNRRFPIKDVEVTRHLCNVRKCVNPEHLEFGSHSDNAKDARNSGSNGCKINMTSAKVIRVLYATKMFKMSQLGAMFGIASGTIGRVIRGERWQE